VKIGWNGYYSMPFFRTIFSISSSDHFRKYYVPHIEKIGMKPKKTLELGGGTGLLSKKTSILFGSEYTVVDNNLKAKAHFETIHRGEGNFIYADLLKDSAFENIKEQYDLVFSDGLIEHFSGENQDKIVQMHKSFCSEQGYVIIAAPTNSTFSKFFSRFVAYEQGFTKAEFEYLLEKNGLMIENMLEDKRYLSALCKKK
jgi:cyclopropane fatty-acyl-phospholipid synthase-like methyltransferase